MTRPETLAEAIARCSEADLYGDDVLSRVVRQVAETIPPSAEIHGVALVVVYRSGSDTVTSTLSTDAWSSLGAEGLLSGCERAAERAAEAVARVEMTRGGSGGEA